MVSLPDYILIINDFTNTSTNIKHFTAYVNNQTNCNYTLPYIVTQYISFSPDYLKNILIPHEYLLGKMPYTVIKISYFFVLTERKMFILEFHLGKKVYPDQTAPLETIIYRMAGVYVSL